MRLRFGIGLGLALITGAGLLLAGISATFWLFKLLGILFGILVLLPGGLLLSWLIGSGRPDSRTEMSMETWQVVDDGLHNAFTDLIFWREYYWLVYVSSPSHFRSEQSRVVLLRSSDARSWQEVRKFDGAGQDIRDPKLGIIQGQLFVYALLNKSFDPEPYRTLVTHSQDGLVWAPLEAVVPDGWLLGRSIALPDGSWVAPAHRIDQGTVVLLRTTDGSHWSIYSTIFSGSVEEHADETAIQLMENGCMLAVSRLESGSSLFGSEQAATLISIAEPPFTSWSRSNRSAVTRLDGPNLFSLRNRLYAVGRSQPNQAATAQVPEKPGTRTKHGSVFGRKRTALFQVDEERLELIHLTDLPSSGDTAYAGAVVRDAKIIISYYSNDPQSDYPWLLGMLLPSRIQISMLDLPSQKTQKDER